MRKNVTIKDIAKVLNVSHVAVSRALRDAPDISNALKEKVVETAEEMGYIANASARSLSSKNSKYNIGMIVPSIGPETAYYGAFTAISTVAVQKKHAVLLGVSNRDISLEQAYCHAMCENRVAALIVAPISSNINELKRICKGTTPLIFIGGKVGFEEPNAVTIDYKNSALTAVEHLYTLGHKKIALFLYAPDNKTIAQKKEGYLSAMKSYELDALIYYSGNATDTYSGGYNKTLELISQGKLPTAIWCASDLMAMGVIDALKESHLSVPDDVSIIGHDNLYFSRFPSFNLTTFEVPKHELGEAAINIALALMNQNPDNTRTQLAFKPALIVRGSTAPPKCD